MNLLLLNSLNACVVQYYWRFRYRHDFVSLKLRKDHLEVKRKCPEGHIVFITELHKCFVAAHLHCKYIEARVSFCVTGP